MQSKDFRQADYSFIKPKGNVRRCPSVTISEFAITKGIDQNIIYRAAKSGGDFPDVTLKKANRKYYAIKDLNLWLTAYLESQDASDEPK